MQIVMLGHTNAGKTSYMSAMYREMAVKGAGGFSVRAVDPQHHRRLLSTGRALLEGRYPDPSDRRHEYALSLRHAAAPLLDFTWKDYRGGAMLDRLDVEDAAQLIADLKSADGILLFLDSLDLQRNAVARQKIRNLTAVIFSALEGRQAPTPVAITLTKSDLLDVSAGDRLLEPFDSFVRAVGGQRSVIGTFIPVACGPLPQNVVLPVLFCLYFGLRAHAERVHADLTEAYEAARYFRARSSWINDWKTSFQGKLSNRQMAETAYAIALQEWQTLEPLLGPLQRLDTFVHTIDIF
ncbi:MAG: TRAFAC clade GTPase domain-containing protein [Kineosporiaceae bacterium]